MAGLSPEEFQALSPSQRDQYLAEQTTQPYDSAGSSFVETGNSFLESMLDGTAGLPEVKGGPQLKLDTEMALAIVTRAHAALDQLDKLKTQAQSLSQMSPAAADMASVSYTKQVAMGDGQAGAFGYGSEHVKFEIDYLTKLIDKLRKAFDLTAEAEQEAKKKIEESGGLLG